MGMSFWRRVAPAAFGVLAFSALAQEAPRELDAVVITATKQPQSLEKVPASVSSVDGRFLRERNTAKFEEVTDYIPNVTMNVSGSSGQFIIRGLGTPDTNLGFDPSVGLIADGVYYGRSNFLSAFFNDIDRYEVMRGPQGTLFGKNSTAGLFNVVSTKPQKDLSFGGEMLARGYADISVRPILNIPLGSSLGLRISGNFQNGSRGDYYNTYLQRPEHNTEQNTLKARLRWVADNGVAVDVQALNSRTAQNFAVLQLLSISDAMYDAIRRYDPNFERDPKKRKVSTDFPAAEKARIQSYAATVDAPLPDFGGMSNLKLTSITAWAQSLATARNFDADFSPIPFVSDQLIEPSRYKQITQEIRFTGNGKDLFGFGHGINFITGVYLLKSTYGSSDLFSLEDFGGALAYCSAAPPGTSNCINGFPGGAGTVGGALAQPLSQVLPTLNATDVNNQNARARLFQREQTIAGFGQFEYQFLEKWSVIAGVRYGTEVKRGDLSSQSTHTCPPGVQPGTDAYEMCPSIIQQIANSDDYTDHRRRTERDYSPKGGLKYAPTKALSTYFTWARGYKSGGYNGLPLANVPQNEYGPERAGSYEFGAKTKLLENRLRMGISAFRTDFDDLQVSTYQGNRFVVLNAAAARSQGTEADAQFLPAALPFLMLRGSFGFSDARYTRYPNGPCYSDQTAANCVQDLGGKRLPFGSRITANVSPNIFFPMAHGMHGTVGLDWVYRSSRYLDVDIDPRKLQPATNVYNAFLLVNDSSDKWALNFGVRNLTDARYYDQILGQPLAPGNFAGSGISTARLFTQSISFKF